MRTIGDIFLGYHRVNCFGAMAKEVRTEPEQNVCISYQIKV